MTGETRVVTHEVRRLEVAVDLPFEELRARYEQAVPTFDPGPLLHPGPHRLGHDQPDHRRAGKLADLFTTLGIAVPAELTH